MVDFLFLLFKFMDFIIYTFKFPIMIFFLKKGDHVKEKKNDQFMGKIYPTIFIE